MTKGTWTATAVDSVILAADASRIEVDLQYASGDYAYLGFGEAAVYGQGIRMSPTSGFLKVSDSRAKMAIHMICNTGCTASGGYQTA